MKGKDIQLWMNWLGVNINNIDVGFVKTILPSLETELDDSVLLDLEFKANDVPTIELGNGYVLSNLQFTLTFMNQGGRVMSLNAATKIIFVFQYDQSSNLLNLNDLQLQFTTL